MISQQDKRKTVLFLCSANSARSQMAEALMRHRSQDEVRVISAGLEPKPIHPMSIRVLEELGLDTSVLRSKDIREFLGKASVNWAIIVCEQARQRCPNIYPFALQTLYWPFDDPAAVQGTEDVKLEKFREVRDKIDERIKSWIEAGLVAVANGA